MPELSQHQALRCALIGSSVAHSLSPLLQEYAAQLAGIAMSYGLQDVEPGGAPAAVLAAQKSGLRGLNVTTPHKEAVLPALDFLDADSKAVAAVNTILFDEAGRHGYNTDLSGAVKLLGVVQSELPRNSAGRPAAILGSGPAARALALALKRSQSLSTVIVTRAVSTSLEAFGEMHAVTVAALGTLAAEDAVRTAVIVINATPLGSVRHVAESPLPHGWQFASDSLVIDLIYYPVSTLLLRQAAKSGCRTLNGTALLAYQAADSFNIWTGCQVSGRNLLEFLQTRGHANALPDSR